MSSGRRVRLVVEYDGTPYCGWQRQESGPSVQSELEDAIFGMTGERVTVTGAGRTDAGVHALGQVASFVTANTRIPVHGFRRGLNSKLPPTIAIASCDDVPLDFDPRRHANGKLYRYRIWNCEARSPIERTTSWHVRKRLDTAAMAEAARYLVGTHDFAAFRASDCERRTTVRELSRVDVTRAGHLVTIEVEGTAFLKNMVRIIVGTLCEVGRGAEEPAWMADVLARRDRTLAGMTVPPGGLYLVRVDYDLPLPPRA